MEINNTFKIKYPKSTKNRKIFIYFDYKDQVKDGKMPEIYEKNEEELSENYEKVLELRENLDERLKTLNEYSDSMLNPEKIRSRSIYLINTLLVILIICLIYFYILDL